MFAVKRNNVSVWPGLQKDTRRLHINNAAERVKSTNSLVCTSLMNLSLSLNTTSLAKRAQQRMHFLRMSPNLPKKVNLHHFVMSHKITASAEYYFLLLLLCLLKVIGTPQRPTVSNTILVNSPHTPSSQFLTQSQPSDASPWSSG